VTTFVAIASILLAIGIVAARQVPPKIPRVLWAGVGPIRVIVSPHLPGAVFDAVGAAVAEARKLGHVRLRDPERGDGGAGCITFDVPGQAFAPDAHLAMTHRVDRDGVAVSATIEFPTDLRGRQLARVASHELFHALGYAHCPRTGHRMHPDAAKIGDDLAGLGV
jgi:hypothetical protein